MEKKFRNRLRLLPLISLTVLVVIVLFAGYLVAKYINQQESEQLYVAKNFYFESDFLSEEGEEYTLKDGVDTIKVSFMNYPDELRTSEVDIDFTVTILDESNNKVGEQSYTLSSADTDNPRDKKTCVFSELSAGEYTVMAVATKPYSKTLRASFNVEGLSDDIIYVVSDENNSPNLLVKVTTADYAGDIVIRYPAGVVPDNTDPLLKDAVGESCIVEVEKNSEYDFQFFKTDPGNKYKDLITVEAYS